MTNTKQIKVRDVVIHLKVTENSDYINITDMAKARVG